MLNRFLTIHQSLVLKDEAGLCDEEGHFIWRKQHKARGGPQDHQGQVKRPCHWGMRDARVEGVRNKWYKSQPGLCTRASSAVLRSAVWTQGCWKWNLPVGVSRFCAGLPQSNTKLLEAFPSLGDRLQGVLQQNGELQGTFPWGRGDLGFEHLGRRPQRITCCNHTCILERAG